MAENKVTEAAGDLVNSLRETNRAVMECLYVTIRSSFHWVSGHGIVFQDSVFPQMEAEYKKVLPVQPAVCVRKTNTYLLF